MTKAKYAILNGKDWNAVLWEDKKIGNVLITNGEEINLSWGLEIWDIEENKVVEYIDLKEFLLKVLPTKEKSNE